MFTFDRKLRAFAAPSPAPKPAPQRPVQAPPGKPLWFRLATSSNADMAASPAMTEEGRRYFEPRLPPTSPPRSAALQREPTISSPADPCEREADEVADKVMRMAEPAPIGSAPAAIRRKIATWEDEEKRPIQTQRAPSVNDDAALDVEAAARVAELSGEPLPKTARDFFEPRFGHDFSRVRVHADGEAADAARAVQARAYTMEQNIVFGHGEYAPTTAPGKRLLAHELAHVVQQQGGGAVGPVRHGVTRQIARTPDPTFGPSYGRAAGAAVDEENHRAAIGKDNIHAPLQAASAFVGKNGESGLKLDPAKPLTADDLEFIYIPTTPTMAKHDVDQIRAIIPDRVKQLNEAFRIMQIDTAEAQAVYLANAYTESWQLRKFKAEADPAVVGQFPGRGALQVTNRDNYLKSLAYLDAEAERLDGLAATDPQAATDARLAHEAFNAIKADPAAAEKPKYAMLISAAFMHAAAHGGVKSVAELSGGVNPTFAGNGTEDTWMTGGQDIAGNLVRWTKKRDDLTAKLPTMAEGSGKAIAKLQLNVATERVTYWTGVEQAAARKDAAYDRAMTRLRPKALNEYEYGYGVPEDPMNAGGFGLNDATTIVRPGPVRTTELRRP